MAKIRIHELAKDISGDSNISADIVKYLQEAGSDVKNHMSSITEEEADRVRTHFAPKKEERVQTADESKEPASDKKRAPQTAPMAGKVGVLKGKNGSEIRYKVGPDGRLINLANGSQLPFKMTKDGIARLDGSPINKPAAKPAPGAAKPAAPKPAQPANKPMTQVFDGRSERDKRMAGGNQAKTTASSGSKGGLTNALGDRIMDLKSQLKPVPVEQPKEAPKPKKPVEEPKAEPIAEAAPKAEPVEAAPKAEPVVEAAPKAEPVKTETPAPKAETQAPAADRPQADKPASDRPQGDRQFNRDGERRNYGDRPQGERRNYGDRPQGDRQGYGRDGERRNYGDRPQGDRQFNRDGERRNYGDRPQGERRPYGDRPQGDRPYNRDGARPYGDRPQGDRPYNRDGARPYGDRPQGDRPYNRDGARPYGDRPQGDRPGFNRDGGRPGFNRANGPAAGAFGGKDKDDDNNGRRNFTRRNDSRPSGGSIKSELANDLGKNQRAESFKDKKREKNDRRDRDFDEEGLKQGKAKKDPNRKGAFQKPVAKPVQQEEDEIKTIIIPEVITIKELADKMKQNAAAIIKKLFMAGKMVNLNTEIPFEEAEEIALEYEIICEKEVAVNVVEELLKDTEEEDDKLEMRAPVVCVMGHVDHGKTSLLDAIRATNVTAREAGGITQHIGAYMVEIDGRKITFLDTPGHEAFTSMRMRGAQSTDIAILVVAADDGVMPQTIEAINHAKAAGVQIIVAVNKIDKPGANIERVKQELTEHELVAVDWGGDTEFVPVSAKTHEGIEDLLEMVLLTADVLELKANPNRNARGIVIEAQLDKGRGPVATVLVQKGTLHVGDNVAIGAAHGKVRAMIDDKGRKVKSAGPSTPVELLGLNAVPEAGEIMMAVADEKEARNIAEAFIAQSKEKLLAETKARLNLEGLFSQIQAGEVKELNLIIKADVMGSVEAVKQSLLKLSNEEVVVRVIHGGVGNINESDVNLASASNAIIIGFNVKPDNTAKDTADHNGVDVRLYRVIYDAINDIEAAMKGMLKPVYEERVIAHAEVRQLFKASGVGLIAGSFVLDGKIERGCSARISREGKQIFDGPLASLKRFKDDVKEVAAGYECGLVFEKWSDLAELDQIEFYKMVEVPRN